MKRLIVIVCCLFVIFAGAASAWANCKQMPFASEQQKRLPVASHSHDHESHGHEHSHQTAIHCPTLDEFTLGASFSLSKEHRVERVLDKLVAEFDSQLILHASRWLSHGPPGFTRLSSIPPYLLLSVFRI